MDRPLLPGIENERENEAENSEEQNSYACEESMPLSLPPEQPPITPQMIKVLAGVCYVNLASNACFSVLASFFDHVSEAKGVTKSEVGLIFGIFAGVNVVVSPILGILASSIGINFMFIGGIVLAAGCTILFSFVNLINGRVPYITFCFLIRGIQAIGCASYFTAALTILSNEWGKRTALAMGFYEISTGLGMIIGPLLGGWLYDIGGFGLPFWVVGALMFFGSIVNYYAVPKINDNCCGSGNMFKLLLCPGVLLTSGMILVTWMGMDFNIPFLEPHLFESGIDASPVMIGLMFMIMAIVYSAVSPLAGWIANKYEMKTVMVIGNLLITVSYGLLGPAPFFQMNPATYTSVIVSMVVLGVGLSMAIVPSLGDLVNEAKRSGMPDNMSTEALVGGYFNAIIFLGEFLGPVIGGDLMDTLKDIPAAMGVFTIICFAVTVLSTIGYIVLYLYRRYSRHKEHYSTIEEEITQSMAGAAMERSGAFGPRQYSLSLSLHSSMHGTPERGFKNI